MLWLYISLGLLALFIILFFVTLFIIYKGTFYSPQKGQDDDFFLTKSTLKYGKKEEIYKMIEDMRNIPYEDVYIKSFDHLKLHARLYRNPSSDTVCIMFHGYRGTPCRDFSGGGKDMVDKGFNVLLVDERAHGLSQGHSITFGVKEKKDAKSWIEYAQKEFGEDKRIVLVGISMGGATVLLVSDILPEGSKVIADCPYSTPKEIICNTLDTMLKMSSKKYYPIANLSSIIFGHANLSKDDAEPHVRNSKAKFMIIHGDIDTVVPYKMSERIYLANKDKVRYELFKGAEHGISYIIDKNRYRRIVNDFLDN